MFHAQVVPAVQWWIDNITVFAQTYPSVLTALWFFLLTTLAVFVYAFKMQRNLAREGLFDKELWERILSLILQHRVKDAVTLTQVYEGIFPRLYKAGLEAAASRKNAADMITSIKEESQERLCRPLSLLTILCLLAPFVGMLATASSAWKVYGDSSLAAAIGLGRLLPPLLPAAAGLLTGILTAMVYGYFSIRIRRIVTQMHLCGLKLLHTLFEQSISRYEAQLQRRFPEPSLAVGASRGPSLSDGAVGASRGPGLPPSLNEAPVYGTGSDEAVGARRGPSWPPTPDQVPADERESKQAGLSRRRPAPVKEPVWDNLTQHHF